MKNLLVILALLSVLSSGYKPQNAIHAGTYKFVKINYAEYGCLFLFRGIRSSYTGTILNISSDSTFMLTTCAAIEKGKWKTVNDSLFLSGESRVWRGPKLKAKYGVAKIVDKPHGYKIMGTFLERVIVTKKGERIIEKLKFRGV